MTDVIRTLDEVGAAVEHFELNQPSLDDVFAEATGPDVGFEFDVFWVADGGADPAFTEPAEECC